MSEETKARLFEHFSFDRAKINRMIERAVQACFAYERGELSLKQVWYRARGERFQTACQFFPDFQVGMRLYELACEFYTYMGVRDDMIHMAIFDVIRAARKTQGQIH